MPLIKRIKFIFKNTGHVSPWKLVCTFVFLESSVTGSPQMGDHEKSGLQSLTSNLEPMKNQKKPAVVLNQ
jgi:hypothetical protein